MATIQPGQPIHYGPITLPWADFCVPTKGPLAYHVMNPGWVVPGGERTDDKHIALNAAIALARSIEAA